MDHDALRPLSLVSIELQRTQRFILQLGWRQSELRKQFGSVFGNEVLAKKVVIEDAAGDDAFCVMRVPKRS